MRRMHPSFALSRALTLTLTRSLAVTTAVALSACGLGEERLRPSASPNDPLAPADGVVEPGEELHADDLPDSLRCVSAPLADTTDVLRLDVVRAGKGFSASITRGPLFWSHEGEPFGADGAAWPQAVTRELVAKGSTLVERTASGTLTIDLARDGAIFTGSFADEQCYLHEATTLTCWNDDDLFGSPWAGEPGALAARFDWATSECNDASGAPARNEVPIEIVRETGFAECADVSGRLNGDDFGYPDLIGFNLVGANLDDAELFFANLTSARLNGAELAGLELGYAVISGSFDDATVRPSEGVCSVEESPWGGATLTCRR